MADDPSVTPAQGRDGESGEGVVKEPGGNLVAPPKPEVGGTWEREHAQKELRLGMAVAAMTFFGIVAIVWQIIETRDANRTAREALAFTVEAQRARVVVSWIDGIKTDQDTVLSIELSNQGQGLARSISAHYYLRSGSVPDEARYDSWFAYAAPNSLVAGERRRLSASGAGLSKEKAAAVIGSVGARFFLSLLVVYRDQFGAEHEDESDFVWSPGLNGWMPCEDAICSVLSTAMRPAVREWRRELERARP